MSIGHAPYEYRFVVCMDVCRKDETDGTEEPKADLVEAYRRLYIAMGLLEQQAKGQIQWESTDEAFGPDGQPIIEEALQEARMTVLDTLPNINVNVEATKTLWEFVNQPLNKPLSVVRLLVVVIATYYIVGWFADWLFGVWIP
jgi:hypothetical protein